jgi:hypothetical protein
MAKTPKIVSVSANRMAEGSIFVSVVGEVNNMASTALAETHSVSGDRLQVVVQQKAIPHSPGTVTTQVAGKKKLQFRVWSNEVDISQLSYVDAFGGDYDDGNMKTAAIE